MGFLSGNCFALSRLLPTVIQLVPSFGALDLEQMDPDVIASKIQLFGNLASAQALGLAHRCSLKWRARHAPALLVPWTHIAQHSYSIILLECLVAQFNVLAPG